ncbi:MAG: hypothetical protein CVU69_08170 [Deltaproteobacteria bacterium HGW-Deltaproteobacteria-4]|nr:MAG: hypothetical protein CVU69_08170 [Deltaproteobacteria bacterium HGW-Deltaproteobacteria-4]
MEIGTQSVCDHLRRQDADLLTDKPIYTKSFTGPLGVVQISDLAKKYDYKFIDDQSTFSTSKVEDIKRYKQSISGVAAIADEDHDINVWVFQGNPNRYDILNALSDEEIGNSIHWLVCQNKNRIHKGHMVLLWMSGKEAGIYALCRIECEPSLISENRPEKKYWLEDVENEIENRVRLSVIRRFVNKPILKKDLLKIPELSKLSILRQFQGTNFPVRDSEWELIAQLM